MKKKTASGKRIKRILRIIKAFILGIAAGAALLQYLQIKTGHRLILATDNHDDADTFNKEEV